MKWNMTKTRLFVPSLSRHNRYGQDTSRQVDQRSAKDYHAPRTPVGSHSSPTVNVTFASFALDIAFITSMMRS